VYVFYVWILDNHQIVFDFEEQQIEWLHHKLRDVKELKYEREKK